MKLLLTSVFGPYGVDDKYGEKENKFGSPKKMKAQ